MTKRSRRVELLLGGLFVLLLTAARSVARQRTVDVGFDDEVFYLSQGLALFKEKTAQAEFGPLYFVWYWVESLFVRDPLALYYRNWSCLLFVNLFLLWLLLREIGASLPTAILWTSVLSLLRVFDTWPWVTLLSEALICGGLLFALRQPDLPRALASVAIAAALASFVRPEMTWVFGVLVVASVVAVVSLRTPRWRAVATVGGPVLLFVLLVAWKGAPVSGERSWLAFGQHYALNVDEASREEHPDKPYVDTWNQWRAFVQPVFGASETIGQALRVNPKAFAWHVRRNLARLAPSLLDAVSPTASGPIGVSLSIALGVAMAVGGGVVLALLALVRGASAGLSRRQLIVPVLVTGSVVLTSLASAIILYPRGHYFVAPLGPLVVLAVWGWGTPGWGAPVRRMRAGAAPRAELVAAGVAALLVGALVPGAGAMRPWWLSLTGGSSPEAPLPNLASVQAIRELALRSKWQSAVLEAELGRSTLAGLGGTIEPWFFPTLDECLRQVRIDVIAVDSRMVSYYEPRHDPTFKRLLGDPASLGFKQVKVPGEASILFVRMDALAQDSGKLSHVQ